MNKYRILVDAMGGDNAPDEILKGVVMAYEKLDKKSVELSVVGDEKSIERKLNKISRRAAKNIHIIHASEVISADESPAKAVIKKQDSSIVRGVTLVGTKEYDVFISAGSTGALLAAGHLILGEVRGLTRPALGVMYPLICQNKAALLLDAGANANCKEENLLDFAKMGSIYMEEVMGVTSPKVGLVNNGAESNKGNNLTKATFKLLKDSKLNFIGNIEARDFPHEDVDVIVADGFTGNIILKLSEGMAIGLLKEIKRKFLEGNIAKLAALALKSKLIGLKDELDYREYGAAPILGLKGGVLKMHGSSDASAVCKSIEKAIPFVENKVVERLAKAMAENIGELDE